LYAKLARLINNIFNHFGWGSYGSVVLDGKYLAFDDTSMGWNNSSSDIEATRQAAWKTYMQNYQGFIVSHANINKKNKSDDPGSDFSFSRLYALLRTLDGVRFPELRS